MLILNFSHPLTEDQKQQIESLTGQPIAKVRDVPSQMDLTQPFAPQIAEKVAALGLTPQDWQNTPILIVPPALNFAAATLLAELHGRMGYFPPVVRLRPVPEALPPRYEVAEIINLQAVREQARRSRG
ncbi:MAG: CRISPR-associated protein Csx15 [Anaerolineales bacterium]